MSAKHGGKAFPRALPNCKVPVEDALSIIEDYSGMTLLDYFAGEALNGICACFRDYKESMNATGRARTAYDHAEAMIAERAKRMTK